MPDREKVIKGLKHCINHDGLACISCPYDRGDCVDDLCADVLALLKEQETKYGYWVNPTSQDCHCSECGNQPEHEPGGSVPLYDFCPDCGAKMEVKWDA